MKKKIMLILIITLLISTLAYGEVIDKTWSRESVSKGEVIEISFPYEVENIDVPQGMEYLGYDNGIHSFIALEDLENAEGYLYFEKIKGEEDIDLGSGDSNDVGDPGEGTGTQVNWNGFELGKHGWNHEIGRQYAIRLDVQDYQEYDYIYLQDISEGLSEPIELDVRIVVPDENGLANTIDSLDYEFVENEEGKFTIKMKVLELNEDEEMRYDVFYKTRKTDNTFSNGYRVYTKSEWEEYVSGGNVTGDNKPSEPIETPEEVIPETPEETPTTDETEEIEYPTYESEETEEIETETEEIEEETEKEEIVEEEIIEEIEDDFIILENEKEETEEIKEVEEVVEEKEVEIKEEVIELLPKTGIAEIFNVVTVIGLAIIMLGVLSLKK